MITGLNEETVEQQSGSVVEESAAAAQILRELVDALIQENLFHLQERGRLIGDAGAYSEVDDFALAPGEYYFSYPLNGGADQLLFRARKQRGFPCRCSRLPVLLLQGDGGGTVTLDAADLMRSLACTAEREDLPDLGGMDRFMRDLAVAEAQTEWAGENIPAALAAIEGEGVGLPAWERLGALRDRPFHPLARAKTGWSLEAFRRYGAESGDTFGLGWVALRNGLLSGSEDLYGTAVAGMLLEPGELQVLREAAAARGIDEHDFTLVPVHPWQLHHRLADEFAGEIGSGDCVPVCESLGRFTPTSSVRSLAPVAMGDSLHVKLPMAIAALGAQRILPPRYLHNGAAAQQLLQSLIGREPALQGKFFCCDERQWLAFTPPGETMVSNRSGHLSCLLRRYPDFDSPDCQLLPMSALTLADNNRVPAFEYLLRSGGEAPEKLFRSLCDHLCALCFTCFSYGLMPEVHGQNLVLAIVKGRIRGLILRDHDTLRIFPPWVRQSGLEAPRYIMDWSTPNSLICLSPQELLRYFQTLGVQVNLHAIADTLSGAYGISADIFWKIIETACHSQLQQLELPDFAKALLRRELLDNPGWPARLLLTPYLMRRTRETGMPAGLGNTRNPLMDHSCKEQVT